MSSTSKSILPVPVPIHRSSLPISPYSPDPLSVPISPSSTKPNPPSITGSTFVNIFKTAIKTYESRSRVNLPMYLGDSYTPDKFRGLIQAQALNLRKQYSRRHSSLFNRLASSRLVLFLTHPRRATRESKSNSFYVIMDFFKHVEGFIKRLELYTKIPPTPEMIKLATEIMVTILSGLVLVNKQIHQGRFRGKDIEEMLQRLDALTMEESQTMVAQTLEVVPSLVTRMEESQTMVAQTLEVVSGLVTKVEESQTVVAQTLEAVSGLVTRTGVVMDDLNDSRDIIRQTQVLVRRMEVNVGHTWLQHDLRRWLSAPDPWTNHNVAYKTRHNGTATWFTQSETFNEWKSTGSVLWIYGIPGSGKTVFCSTIIQNIWSMYQTGLANLAFFYFDHKDAAKLDARSLLSSLLIQLCNQSDHFCEVLSTLYMAHDRGSRQPGEDELMQCLRDMIRQGKSPVYIIVDALDECPDSTGLGSPRAAVLEIIRGLIGLSPRVYLCITSRPEMDIRRVLRPLTSHIVSLDQHDGQHKDIAEYVKFVVHSDSRMREWPEEDKNLVSKTLTQNCDGMFRWASCQLETLRYTPLQSIRRALIEFPEALDETYERVLRVINKKWEYAHRIFQCLTVSARPLRIEELAEVFTIEVDAKLTGIPEFNARWRHKDVEEAVLSVCSSLVAVVELHEERIVQFSHFSVQQFLTSDRIANSKDFSKFHILLEPAHTFLARTCLSLLLQLDERKEKGSIHDSPLHRYAAEHWVDHARFGNVSSSIQEGMERLFDRDKPHFAAWIGMYNLDRSHGSPLTPSAYPSPLYYAALCGFYDLANHLLVTHPHYVNARGGRHVTPLHAALDKGHVKVAQLLLQHGADVSAQDGHDRTPFHLAAECGDSDVLRSLINHDANPNAQNKDQETPLFLASRKGRLEAARLLLEHVTDMNHQDSLGRTPLHVAAENGHYDISRLLLDNHADVNAPEKNLKTPLHLAVHEGRLAVAQLLLEHGAEVDARDKMDWTPLHFASQQGHLGLVRLLLEHHADVLARNLDDHTFLDVAWTRGHEEIIDINARYEDGQTALHIASQHGDPELVHWLIDQVNPSAENDDQETPLFPASRNGKLEATRLLLDAGADANHRDWQQMTALHGASENGHDVVTQLLLEHNAAVNAGHVYDWTPLHLASRTGKGRTAKVLLDGGAMVNAQNDSAWTPLHMASQKGHLNVVELLLARDADVNTQEAEGETALHLAAFYGHFEVVQVLLKNDADVRITNKEGETPLDLALKEHHDNIEQLLKQTALVREWGGELVAEQVGKSEMIA